MKYIIFMILLSLTSSLLSAPVVIKSKQGRLRDVVLEIDDNPYTAPELILGSSGVTILFLPGVVQSCEISFNGYDYRKGNINQSTKGIFQEIVLRYDLSKIAAESREKLLSHRFSVICSFEYRGKSKYIEFDTVFNDSKRYSFAWIKFKDDLQNESINLNDYNGFQFVELKGDKITINDGSVEKAFGNREASKPDSPNLDSSRGKKENPLKGFQQIEIKDGNIKVKD